MDVPKGFVPKKKIEEIVRKTVVKETIVKDIAKEIEQYLENKRLAEILKVNFEKFIDLSENKDLDLRSVKKKYLTTGGLRNIDERVKPDFIIQVQNRIFATEKSLNDLVAQETDKILENIRKTEPRIKEEEIVKTYPNSFNVTLKNCIYKIHLQAYWNNDGKVNTDEVFKAGRVFKKRVPVVNVYINQRIAGTVKYAKFDKEHNEKLMSIFKERGYYVTINIENNKEK